MLKLEELEKEVKRIAAIIGAPEEYLPTYGYSEQTARPHIEITGNEYNFVVAERGTEFKRIKTKDLQELVYLIFEGVTFSMACKLELKNRRENEDFRIQLFQIQEDLINQINAEYAERLRERHKKLLK